MRAARSKAAADSEVLAAIDRQLATTERITKLPELNQVIVAAATGRGCPPGRARRSAKTAR